MYRSAEIECPKQWRKYYQQSPVISGFCDDYYLKAFKTVHPSFTETNRDNPLTFILGGFFPYNNTAPDFKQLVSKLYPDLPYRLIYLDMNYLPVSALNPSEYPLRVQGNLSNLPFKNSSAHGIFLDYTLNFMNKTQIKEFGQRINDILTQQGLILAVIKYPSRLLPVWGKILNKVNIYSYSIFELQKLLDPLKLVCYTDMPPDELTVFQKVA